MGKNDPNNQRVQAAKIFTDKLDLSRDKGGVVSWDDDIDFTFDLSSDLLAVKTNLDRIDTGGDTDLNVGLNAAISMLDSNIRTGQSSKAIIFLSDGEENYTPSGTPGSPADNARAKGYKIFSIGLNIEPGSSEETNLKDIAVATGGQYYFPPSAENLQAAFDNIFQIIVTKTAPTNVDIIEVTQPYLQVNQSTFSIEPTSLSTTADGKTMITWEDLGRQVGNRDSELTADERIAVSFSAAVPPGMPDNPRLPVNVEGESMVQYSDPDGKVQTVTIPQEFIEVKTAQLTSNGSSSRPVTESTSSDNIISSETLQPQLQDTSKSRTFQDLCRKNPNIVGCPK
jgi:Ca-activated chloride channel family protein